MTQLSSYCTDICKDECRTQNWAHKRTAEVLKTYWNKHQELSTVVGSVLSKRRGLNLGSGEGTWTWVHQITGTAEQTFSWSHWGSVGLHYTEGEHDLSELETTDSTSWSGATNPNLCPHKMELATLTPARELQPCAPSLVRFSIDKQRHMCNIVCVVPLLTAPMSFTAGWVPGYNKALGRLQISGPSKSTC